MWTRKDLKQRAKDALKRNYWKIVLVAVLAAILGGSRASSSTTSSGTLNTDRNADANIEYADGVELVVYENTSEAEKGILDAVVDTLDAATRELSETQIMIVGIMVGAMFLLIALFLMVFIYAMMALLYNPFYAGVCRFMLKSVDDKAEVKEVAYGFDHSYKNIVKTMFHMDIRVFAWTLLFIIPGICKKYQYRMVPYILAEHPDMDYKEVLMLSSDIMNGEKWNAFVLDLSFILWHLLGIITCGIVELFFVNPYVYLTHAALYRRLCELRDDDSRQVLS